MRVLLILAHPRDDSLCAALASSFIAGMQAGGVTYQALSLTQFDFDPHVRTPSPADQPLEADLRSARALIDWADHLVFIYPTWWGTYPALLKGFLDRILAPGYAFRYRGDGTYAPLLKGKSAEMITTMDTPGWVYRLIYRAPGRHALAAATLGFCGIRTVRHQSFKPVITSSAEQRAAWLAAAHARGRALAHGALTPSQRRFDVVIAWLLALRLQFYPLTALAYSIGALAAAGTQPLLLQPFLYGLFGILLIEAATVFSNDVFDYESDRRNENAGPFNGGSRVLVDGRLHMHALGTGAVIAFCAGLLLLAMALVAAPTQAHAIAIVAFVVIIAVGYTVPPLKLSHRGAGELDVIVTHSIGVLLPGYLLQGGAWNDALPWLLALPLGLSVLPSITLANVPDYTADRAAGKRTLAVQLGRRGAIAFAIATTLVAATVAVGWALIDEVANIYRWVAPFAVLHAALLAWRLAQRLHGADALARIDGLIALALSYVLWFAVIPFFKLI